mgnify:CR=1 FL=1
MQEGLLRYENVNAPAGSSRGVEQLQACYFTTRQQQEQGCILHNRTSTIQAAIIRQSTSLLLHEA